MMNTEQAPDRAGLTRRLFLLIGGGSIAALGLGAIPAWSRYKQNRATWIEQAVRRNLPEALLDEPSLAAFVRQTLDGPMLRSKSQQFAAFAQSAAPWVANRVPKVRSALEKRERQVLTDYLLGSNFFQLSDPRRELVVYHGPPVACANPFARFA